MSYKNLNKIDVDITQLRQDIKRYQKFILKVNDSIKVKREMISELASKRELIKESLLMNNVKVGDEITSNLRFGYSKLKIGDLLKAIRVNKKSITFQILSVGEKRPTQTDEHYNRECNRIGITFRISGTKLNTLLYSNMEKAIVRNEKLKALVG